MKEKELVKLMKEYKVDINNVNEFVKAIQRSCARAICEMIECDFENNNKIIKFWKKRSGGKRITVSCYDRNIALSEIEGWIKEKFALK